MLTGTCAPVKSYQLYNSLAVGLGRRGYRYGVFVDAPRAAWRLLPPIPSLVVAGLLNKQIGGRLRISEITVKAHRGQVMRRMQADSLADLFLMAGRLGLQNGAPA